MLISSKIIDREVEPGLIIMNASKSQHGPLVDEGYQETGYGQLITAPDPPPGMPWTLEKTGTQGQSGCRA